jgi:hypothetical protein
MARTTRRETPQHIATIEAILQERGWSVATVIARTRATGDHGRGLSADTMYKVLRGHTPSWPVQAKIAAALSLPEQQETIGATQLFGHRPLPAWVLEITGSPMAVAA